MNRVKRILVSVLVLNWLVAALKIIFGYVIHSASMSADGFHSFSDGASNVVALIGMGLACMPKDEGHPYGHKKYETFTTVIIASLLFIIAFHLVHDTIGRFKTGISPRINSISLGIMVFTIIVNIVVMAYENKMGKILKSDILIADSLHTRSDILTSLSVIAALISARLGAAMVDPICSIIISLFIACAGFRILISSSKVLCDGASVGIGTIERIVKGIDGVLECHDIRTRGRSDDIYIDLHVRIRADTHIDKADHICDEIEKAIKENISGVNDVIVHAEPAPKKKVEIC